MAFYAVRFQPGTASSPRGLITPAISWHFYASHRSGVAIEVVEDDEYRQF
jgi:hypothetical protein